MSSSTKLERVDSKGEGTWFGADQVDAQEDGAASDDSQETAFSATTGGKTDLSTATSTENIEELQDEDSLEESPLLGVARKKGKYPYGPLFFIMTATAGQR